MLCANDISAGGLARLTEVYGSLGEIVRAGRREVAQVIGQDASRVLFSDDKVRECEAACAWLAAGGGADIVVLSDPDYPKRLLQLPRPPAVLFVRGRRGVLSDKAAIFLTGTRRPDDEGRRNAEDFGRAIARRAALLTGFEEGVEMAAAAAALKSEKRDENCTVIGVQATGPDRIFPASARELFYAAAERGLLVSPFVPGVGYASENDVVRRSVSLALSRRSLSYRPKRGRQPLPWRAKQPSPRVTFMLFPARYTTPFTKGATSCCERGLDLSSGWRISTSLLWKDRTKLRSYETRGLVKIIFGQLC